MAVERPDLIRHEAIVHQPEIPITGDVFSSENHMPDLVVEQKIPFEVDRVPSSEELYSVLANEKPELISFTKRMGEKIVNYEKVPFVHPDRLPDPISVLVILSGVNSVAEIGKNGIPYAAANTKENQHIHELELYSTGKFYRDGDEIASAYLEEYPELMHGMILEAAALQGITYEPVSEEEPGRILHEHRLPGDERGRKIGWPWPYYGAIDTTPAFINNVAAFRKQQRTGEQDILSETIRRKDGEEVEIRQSVLDAANWIIEKIKITKENPEGLIEFKSSNPQGIANQVWKDSWDSYFHTDGTLANHERGIAPIEVQVSAYKAFQELSQFFPEKADEYNKYSEHLKKQIFDKFWIEKGEKGYFVIGTDRDGEGNLRQLDILTSNAASVLDADLLMGDDKEKVRKRQMLIKTLFSKEMWSNAGLRTLASNELRFHPDAYHNGSVWLQDNADFARGLARHGYYKLAGHVYDKIREVVHVTRMYPEKVTGDEGSVARLNRWNVDVQTPDGNTMRTAQPAQILQGFALAAYKEAVDFDKKMQLGMLSDTLTDSEIVFEIGQVTNIGQLEKLRKDAVTIKQMQALDSFAAD